jgi:hypothetical protein
MRTPRFAIGLFTLAAATTVLAQTHPTGPLTSADAAMRYHLSLENQVPPPRLWVAAKAAPDGASSVVAAGSAESADRRLQQIVGAYSRERLHRSSWFNPWAQPPSMAPEPLTAVAPGNGVTSPGESPARPAPQTLAGQVRP